MKRGIGWWDAALRGTDAGPCVHGIRCLAMAQLSRVSCTEMAPAICVVTRSQACFSIACKRQRDTIIILYIPSQM